MSEKLLTTDDDLHRLPTDQDLTRLQRTTVLYYLHETNPDNGLVRDKTHPDIPCSIAAVGMALATIPVVVERGVVIRKFAAKIARRRLRSLLDLPQGPDPGAAGHKGFFYHFLGGFPCFRGGSRLYFYPAREPRKHATQPHF